MEEVTDISAYWQDDLVYFLIGCSFSFESELLQAGVPVRHIEEGRNVPMFNTNLALEPAGVFHGNMVVSMRPIPHDLVVRSVQVTSAMPRVHGAPVQIGDPAAIGNAEKVAEEIGKLPSAEGAKLSDKSALDHVKKLLEGLTENEKAMLVPVSRVPALLSERDADKSPVLECIDLGITFGGLKAVDNFNVTIGRTEITGLIGPNGAGKTTVFNLLTKVYQPTHGTILLNGKDIQDLSNIFLHNFLSRCWILN